MLKKCNWVPKKASQCTAQLATIQYNAAPHGMARHGTAWHGMARHGTAWHGMARHGTAWHGMAWHGTAWHSTPLTQLLHCSQWGRDHIRTGHREVCSGPTRAEALVTGPRVQPHATVLHLQQGPSLGSSFYCSYTPWCSAACCKRTQIGSTPCATLPYLHQICVPKQA